jgi:hypothetical protein
MKLLAWIILVILGSFQFECRAWAQTQDVSFHVGTLLPTGIHGITETQPMYGFRYALPLSFASLESGYANTHAKGVDFNDFSFDLRAESNVLPNFINLFYAGLDLNYYKPDTTTAHYFKVGFNFGTALMMQAFEKVWLRADLKYSLRPGGTLYIGVGLLYRF